MEVCVGMLVRSRAGRDAGRWCMVLAVQDGYALLADGDMHPLERPKRKKLMHLAPSRTVWAPAEFTGNKRLKQALAAFGRGAVEGGQELV